MDASVRDALHPHAWATVESLLLESPDLSDDDLERIYHEERRYHAEMAGSQAQLGDSQRPYATPPPRSEASRHAQNSNLSQAEIVGNPLYPGAAAQRLDQQVHDAAAHIRADLSGKWTVEATWTDGATVQDHAQGYRLYLHHDPATGCARGSTEEAHGDVGMINGRAVDQGAGVFTLELQIDWFTKPEGIAGRSEYAHSTRIRKRCF